MRVKKNNSVWQICQKVSNNSNNNKNNEKHEAGWVAWVIKMVRSGNLLNNLDAKGKCLTRCIHRWVKIGKSFPLLVGILFGFFGKSLKALFFSSLIKQIKRNRPYLYYMLTTTSTILIRSSISLWVMLTRAINESSRLELCWARVLISRVWSFIRQAFLNNPSFCCV